MMVNLIFDIPEYRHMLIQMPNPPDSSISAIALDDFLVNVSLTTLKLLLAGAVATKTDISLVSAPKFHEPHFGQFSPDP